MLVELFLMGLHLSQYLEVDRSREGKVALISMKGKPLMNLERFICPILHVSKGINGCSPQGFVADIFPSAGVVLSFSAVFKKYIPGSPESQAFLVRSLVSQAVRSAFFAKDFSF